MGREFPYMMFYAGDWLNDPRLSLCSAATRGVWIDLICAMHLDDRGSRVTGGVSQLARLCRCSPSEIEAALAELGATKTAEVSTDCHGLVTVVCRRLAREGSEREKASSRQRKARFSRGASDVDHPENGSVTPLSRSCHADTRVRALARESESESESESEKDNALTTTRNYPVTSARSTAPSSSSQEPEGIGGEPELETAWSRWAGHYPSANERRALLGLIVDAAPIVVGGVPLSARDAAIEAIGDAVSNQTPWSSQGAAIRWLAAVLARCARDGCRPGRFAEAAAPTKRRGRGNWHTVKETQR